MKSVRPASRENVLMDSNLLAWKSPQMSRRSTGRLSVAVAWARVA